jgi:hypothetical protein
LFVNVTFVCCPVGLRTVNPGYVPPYVHIFVHGPSRICTHPSSILIETFASVFTGGKSRGFEKGAGVGVGVGVPSGVEVCGAGPKRKPIAPRTAANISASKALALISIDHESLLADQSGITVSAPEWDVASVSALSAV